MLTEDQRAKLTAEAEKRGVDANELIAAAESLTSKTPPKSAATPSAEKPKLFMYLLPFVTVKEVRQNWLELSESFPGDEMPAAGWAAKFASAAPAKPDEPA